MVVNHMHYLCSSHGKLTETSTYSDTAQFAQMLEYITHAKCHDFSIVYFNHVWSCEIKRN